MSVTYFLRFGSRLEGEGHRFHSYLLRSVCHCVSALADSQDPAKLTCMFLLSEAVMNFCLALNHFLSSPNLFTLTRAGNDASTRFSAALFKTLPNCSI